MIKVLFLWHPEKSLQDYILKGFGNYPNVELIFPEDLNSEILIDLAIDAHVIVGWRPGQEMLGKARQLSLFIAPGAGVQHLIKPFKELNLNRKVILVNGHGNSYFTATHGVALLMSLMNKIIPHHNWMVNGEWRKGDEDAASIPLRNRKIGLLGYGSINSKIHRFLSGFEVKFAALRTKWARKNETELSTLKKFTISKLDEFLKYVDILFVSLPLTQKTEGLINEKQLQLLGKNGLLVSLGRGPVIDEKALYYALKNRIIEGAAIDVWYKYRPEKEEEKVLHPANFPFHELDNVVLSPHRAASPFDDLKRWDEVIENISRFADKRDDFMNIVDLDKGY